MSLGSKIANNGLYTLAAAIVASTVVMAYLLLVPVSVLKNWNVSIVNMQPSYKAGDTVIVQSTYTKTRNINGIAHRHLECTSAQVQDESYLISSAVANHPEGQKTGTGVKIVIPNIAAPAKCHVSIDVNYKVFPFRTVTQYNHSADFTVTD